MSERMLDVVKDLFVAVLDSCDVLEYARRTALEYHVLPAPPTFVERCTFRLIPSYRPLRIDVKIAGEHYKMCCRTM